MSIIAHPAFSMSILVDSVHTSGVILSTSAQSVLSRHFVDSHFPSHRSSLCFPWSGLEIKSAMLFTPAASLNISSSVSDCGHGVASAIGSTSSPLEFATTPSPLSAGSSLASLHTLGASIGAGGASTLSLTSLEKKSGAADAAAASPSSFTMLDLTLFRQDNDFKHFMMPVLAGRQIWMPEAETDKPVKNIAQ
ncbi:hypothetical protein C8R44DRAFT_747586 [Mycena epipterygia]|nr:hypothetical protein C8R44DRAFT_747586 [Mycena epipterygia]